MSARSSVYGPTGAWVSKVRTLAVLRANALGDFILTLPALQALRDSYPKARIVLLGKQWHHDFLLHRPRPVDEVVVLPEVPGVTVSPETSVDHDSLSRFYRAYRDMFDLIVQLHGGGRYSNWLVNALRPRVSAGFQTADAPALHRNFPYFDDGHPVALRMLECVTRVGAVARTIRPQLCTHEGDFQELDAVWPRSARPFVVLQPGAQDGRRCWSATNFARVGDYFAKQGNSVVVHGGPGETDVVRAVVTRMQSAAVDLSGKLSPGGLAGLLSRAALLVSNDTGPAHLAQALGTPTVVIFWVGNLSAYRSLGTELHRVAVSYQVDCNICGARCVGFDCGHRASFVNEVAFDEVLGHARYLFERFAFARFNQTVFPEHGRQ